MFVLTTHANCLNLVIMLSSILKLSACTTLYILLLLSNMKAERILDCISMLLQSK